MHRLRSIEQQLCGVSKAATVAVIYLDDPPTNGLSGDVRQRLVDQLRGAEHDPSIHFVVILGKGPSFSLGMDLGHQTNAGPPRGQTGEAGETPGLFAAQLLHDKPTIAEVCAEVSRCPKPVIAAINGVCYSAALTVAMACHYRIASASAVFSYPEVLMHVIPGGGAAQRLTRLVGVPAALSIICTGRKVRFNEAVHIGLVDASVPNPDELLARAVAFGSEVFAESPIVSHRPPSRSFLSRLTRSGDRVSIIAPAGPKSGAGGGADGLWRGYVPRRLSEDASKLGSAIGNSVIFHRTAQKLRSKHLREVTAPLKCLEAVRIATMCARDFEEGVRRETALLASVVSTPAAKGAEHALTSCRTALGQYSDRRFWVAAPSGSGDSDDIRRAGVVCGGIEGQSITIALLRAKTSVLMIELNKGAALRTFAAVRDSLRAGVARGELDEFENSKLFARLSVLWITSLGRSDQSQPSDSFTALFAQLDAVFTVFEGSSEIGEEAVLRDLRKWCSPKCLFVTTSVLPSVAQLAKATEADAARVVGMHFTAPIDSSPLLEIVRCPSTAEWAVRRSLRMGQRMGKAMVVVADSISCPSQRLLRHGLFQAYCLLEDGCFPREVDHALRRFGFSSGILRYEDEIGLDVHAHQRHSLPPLWGGVRNAFDTAEELVRRGRLGVKSGRGWHRYERSAVGPPSGAAKDASLDASLQEGAAAGVRDEEGYFFQVPSSASGGVTTAPRPNGTTIPGPPLAQLDTEVENLILKDSRTKRRNRREVSNKEIVERIVFAMVNEAYAMLLEGVVSNPSDVDVISVHGMGFPSFRGGLLYYSSTVGLPTLVKQMDLYHKTFGDSTFPRPCPLLAKLAADKM